MKFVRPFVTPSSGSFFGDYNMYKTAKVHRGGQLRPVSGAKAREWKQLKLHYNLLDSIFLQKREASTL
jgi:hypothetical protein